MKLEFATTAVCRPDLINKTYASFTKNLVDVDFKRSTLYINVDPIPYENDPNEVVTVAKRYFGNVIPNIPKKPNFCQALKWCWAQPKNNFFFSLEDDWILLKQISVASLIKLIERQKGKCLGINLRAYSHIHDRRICLSPCLLRSKPAKEIAAILNIEYNPEKQLRIRCPKNPMGGKTLGYFTIHFPSIPIIKDTGINWLRKNGAYKRTYGPKFITWKRIKH